jgi:hypothetical protein
MVRQGSRPMLLYLYAAGSGRREFGQVPDAT